MKTSVRVADRHGFESVNREDRSGRNGPTVAPAFVVAAL